MEATSGFEPEDGGFADLCLTTWLRRLERVCWSGRRDLNPRLQPWQGCTLPLSYSRSTKRRFTVEPRFCQALFLKNTYFFSIFSVCRLTCRGCYSFAGNAQEGPFSASGIRSGGAGGRPLQCPSWRRQIRLPWVIIEEERAAPYFEGKKDCHMQQIRTVSIGEVQAFLQNHPGGFLIDVLPRIPRPATYPRLIRRLRLRNGFSGEDAGSGAGYGRAALGIRSGRLFG